MERTRTTGKSSFQDSSHFRFTPDESALSETLEDFMHKEEKKKPKIWNFATIAGIVMSFVGLTALIQTLGVNMGPNLNSVIQILPIIGGVLVTIIGFGFIAGKKGKVRGVKRAKKSVSGHFGDTVESGVSGNTNYFQNRSRKSNKSKKKATFQSDKSNSNTDSGIDEYALSKRKKLYKSREDKKILGVCGGIAKYFGIDPTIVRLIFLVGTILGYGSFFVFYIVLHFVVPKEPKDVVN